MQHVNNTTLDAACDFKLWTVISSLPTLAVISCMQHVNKHNTRCCLRFQALDCDIKFASLSCELLRAACQQHNTRCCSVYSSLDCDIKFANLSCGFLEHVTLQHVINTPQDAAWDIQLWTVISSLPALAAVCMSSTHD